MLPRPHGVPCLKAMWPYRVHPDRAVRYRYGFAGGQGLAEYTTPARFRAAEPQTWL